LRDDFGVEGAAMMDLVFVGYGVAVFFVGFLMGQYFDRRGSD
jgi:hypothetical protein